MELHIPIGCNFSGRTVSLSPGTDGAEAVKRVKGGRREVRKKKRGVKRGRGRKEKGRKDRGMEGKERRVIQQGTRRKTKQGGKKVEGNFKKDKGGKRR